MSLKSALLRITVEGMETLVLDNSAAAVFRECPLKYYERYIKGLEPVRDSEALSFGTRVHELLAGYFGGPTAPVVPEGDLELEAQAMMVAYRQHWPREQDGFDVLEVERTFAVNVADDVKLAGKFDAIIERHDGLYIFEHKTEKSGGKRNSPQAWATRGQVSLYIWAAQEIYKRPFKGIVLDVLTRRSPKGHQPVMFRRDDGLVRTTEQQEQAVKDFLYVAQQIQRLKPLDDWREWPANRDNCFNFWECSYNKLHLYGRDELQLVDFKQAKPYLDL